MSNYFFSSFYSLGAILTVRLADATCIIVECMVQRINIFDPLQEELILSVQTKQEKIMLRLLIKHLWYYLIVSSQILNHTPSEPHTTLITLTNILTSLTQLDSWPKLIHHLSALMFPWCKMEESTISFLFTWIEIDFFHFIQPP